MTAMANGGWSGIDTMLLLVVVLLVAFSGFLAFAETALTRTSRVRAVALAEQKHRGAAKLYALLQDPAGFLNPVLLLTLLAQLVAATLVGVLADNRFGGIGVAVATIFEVVIIFTFGEAVPKNLAVRNPDRAALMSAPLVSIVKRLWPVRALSAVVMGVARLVMPSGADFSFLVSEEELLAMADAAMEGEVIATDERALIHSIINFGDTVAREVMVPRPDMVAVEADVKVDDVIGVVLDAGFSRIPVFQESIDNVVGIILAKDLLAAERRGKAMTSVLELIRPAHFVPETKPVSDLLKEMRGGKFHIAIVVDEYGSTVGLVTLEDLIEELVGEISDEYDKEVPPIRALEGSGYEVVGYLPTHDLEDLLGVAFPEGDWDTVGGLVLGLLGHLPEEGESVATSGFVFIAQTVVGRRLGYVRVLPYEAPGDDQ